VGFNILFSKRFSLEQTFFYYRITNHIIPTRIPSTLFSLDNIVSDSIGMWVNFAESFSNVGGSQTTLRFKNIVQSIHLNAEVNLYFQARRDRLPNVQELVKDYFTLTPTHSGKLKVSMEPADNLYLYLESHWMSKWLRILIPFEEIYSELFGSTDGYYAMNGTVRYNLSDQLSAFVKVTNIFDEKYGNINATLLEENLVYNPQLRRTIRAGLSYRFN
jgi:outer membrane receptor protein involved in Fe transport